MFQSSVGNSSSYPPYMSPTPPQPPSHLGPTQAPQHLGQRQISYPIKAVHVFSSKPVWIVFHVTTICYLT